MSQVDLQWYRDNLLPDLKDIGNKETADDVQVLLDEIVKLRRCVRAHSVYHTPIARRKLGDNEYYQDALERYNDTMTHEE